MNADKGRTIRAHLCLAAAVFCCWSVAGQQPTFRSRVEFVQIDAVVTDKDDRPVKGLTQADFEIVERGNAQAIASFQFISIAPAHRAVDVRTAAPAGDVVSNAHSAAGRQWVLVIDDLHIIELHLLHTKKVVQAFLESLPADDQVAIVFVGRSDLSQDFTSDLAAQLRTVDRIKGALGFAYDAADRGGADAVPRVSAAERHRYGVATTDVVKNVAASLARSSYSRKAIAYVSEGITYPLVAVPSGGPGIEDSYESDIVDRWHEAFDVARTAGVPIYAIDPRGPADCTFVRGDCGGGPPREKIQHQQDHLRELAENTGGRAFVSRPDMGEAVRELVDDNSSYYLLGYYPEPLERDGRFHAVEVRIKGRPDLKVRARAGYTAPKAGAAGAASKDPLADALGAALPIAGLQLRAAAAPVALADKGMTTAVMLDVTYPDLPPAKFEDTLAFGIVALDREGKVKAQRRETFHYSATPKPGQDVSYMIGVPIDLPSQALTLRIAVASEALDRVASIHLPVEVMNPTRDALQFGALVLAFAGEPRQAAVPAGALKALMPVQPTLARTFAPSDTIRIHAPLFWRGKDLDTVIVSIAVRNDETTARATRVTLTGTPVNSRSVSRLQQATLNGSLALSGLPPGHYLLDLEAHLTSGSIARRTVAFAVR